MNDLIDSLFRDTASLSEAGSGFSRFMTCDDFGVAVSFLRYTIGLWTFREWGVVQHFHDVKRRQPNIEASCGFEPPCMIGTGQTRWPDLEEWDTLGDSGKRWAAGTVL
jgi:hypothetical protein